MDTYLTQAHVLETIRVKYFKELESAAANVLNIVAISCRNITCTNKWLSRRVSD
jgi:hypothetical protein